MEFFLQFVVELILEFILLAADWRAGKQSRPNRRARREAKKNQLPPPPRSNATRMFLLLSVVAVLLGLWILLRFAVYRMYGVRVGL